MNRPQSKYKSQGVDFVFFLSQEEQQKEQEYQPPNFIRRMSTTCFKFCKQFDLHQLTICMGGTGHPIPKYVWPAVKIPPTTLTGVLPFFSNSSSMSKTLRP